MTIVGGVSYSIKYSLLVAALGIATGCQPRPTPPVLPQGPSPETGFQAFETARTFDEPGTIYRMSNGTLFYVGKIDVRAEGPLPESTPTVKASETLKVGGLLKLLNIGVQGLTGEVKANLNSDVTVSRSLRETARHRISDQGLDEALQAYFAKRRWRKGDEYFLIRETISAKQVDISIDQQSAKLFGGEASFKELVKAKGEVATDAKGSLVLKETYPEAYRLYYKAEKITQLDTKGLERGGKGFALAMHSGQLNLDRARNKPRR